MRQVVETTRLFLRELNLHDATDFYRLNLNPDVVKHTGDAAFKSIEEAERFLINYTDYKINGFGRWAVIDKLNNNFLGWCGLKYNKKLDKTDIGFRFFEECWNKGFATESTKACIKYGFEKLNLKVIIGRTMLANIASIKVLEKIGLWYEKIFNFNNQRGVVYKIEKGELLQG